MVVASQVPCVRTRVIRQRSYDSYEPNENLMHFLLFICLKKSIIMYLHFIFLTSNCMSFNF